MASGTRLSYRLYSNIDKLFIVIFTFAIIVILINPLFLISLNIQKVFASEFPDKDTNDKLDYISDLFEFGTGVFAAILCVLCIKAYRNLKTKRLLLISIAFGIFALNLIISKLEVFGVTIDYTILDLVLAILTFAALTLFFMAIVRRERLKSKTTTDHSSTRF
jgi:hypothetical protein